MSGNQLPVLTLDFDESKIKELNEISEKFKAALSVGPGGFPVTPQHKPPATRDKRNDTRKNNQDETNNFDKFFKELGKNAQGANKTFGLINRTLSTTTSTLKGLFTQTVSWAAKIAAIGGGGLFGFGFLAHRVNEKYKSSQGLGITTGQQQAANNVYGSRISSTGNILDTLAAAQNDPTNPQYAGLLSLGINPQNSAAENLPKLLEGVSALLKQYKGTGVSQTVLKAHGLDGLIDVATANQVLANSDRLPQLNKQYREQSGRLDQNLGGGTQESYQNLSAGFAYNADRIGNTFLKTLARLNGPIAKISDDLTASIERFLNGRNGQALFDTLAGGLQRLGDWLGSDKFRRDLDEFSKAVAKIARAIGSAIEWLAGYGIKAPSSVDDARQGSSFNVNRTQEELDKVGLTEQQARDKNGGAVGFVKALGNTTLGLLTGGKVTLDSIEERSAAGGWANYSKNQLQARVSKVNSDAGLPAGLLPAVAERESSWNPKALNKHSGAAGLFQFISDTGRRYGLTAEERFDPEKSASAAANYFQDNLKRYGGDIAKSLAQYNGGNAAVRRDGSLNLKKETVDYLLKILPKVEGGADQHPGIIGQLSDASRYLSMQGNDARATIKLDVNQKPGSDIATQVQGIYITQR